MANNPSVKQFRADMLALRNQVGKAFRNEFLAQAEELVGNIQRAIPHSVTGHLRESVRKKDVSTDTKPSVLVLAGGSKTTKRTAAGEAFDYALAEEFGTVKQAPRPFFYSTVRAYKSASAAGLRETLDEAIRENNKIRELRNSGSSGAYRGAFTLKQR